MMIPILQMQKVRLREAQKLSKLWQMAKLTRRHPAEADSLRAMFIAVWEAVPGSC